MFHGNKILSLFQLARGDAPSKAIILSGQVDKDILNTHIEFMASIRELSSCKLPIITLQDAYKKKDRIYLCIITLRGKITQRDR